MMDFEDKYFAKFRFTAEQVEKNLANAMKDFGIAQKDEIEEVKFNYAYSALIKSGIALLSHKGMKIKSVPGHHIKIIEAIAALLDDEAVNDMGNLMRSKRNTDLYEGGVNVTEKESREYIMFVDKVIERIKGIILKS
jgi:uncharacterized protein (UPF0332 family)